MTTTRHAVKSGAATAAGVLAVLVMLTASASLAIKPCDTIPDRDGKYFGRFFLGVATLGLSEVTIQQEEVRQAVEGSHGCPPPPGVRVVTAPQPSPTAGPSVALGTLVNGAPWTIVVYLNQDPDAPGAAPLTFLAPNASLQLAFRPGQYRLVARPSGALPGTLPAVTWNRTARHRPPRPGIQAPIRASRLQVTPPCSTAAPVIPQPWPHGAQPKVPSQEAIKGRVDTLSQSKKPDVTPEGGGLGAAAEGRQIFGRRVLGQALLTAINERSGPEAPSPP